MPRTSHAARLRVDASHRHAEAKVFGGETRLDHADDDEWCRVGMNSSLANVDGTASNDLFEEGFAVGRRHNVRVALAVIVSHTYTHGLTTLRHDQRPLSRLAQRTEVILTLCSYNNAIHTTNRTRHTPLPGVSATGRDFVRSLLLLRSELTNRSG
jgi:hypothetical protein